MPGPDDTTTAPEGAAPGTEERQDTATTQAPAAAGDPARRFRDAVAAGDGSAAQSALAEIPADQRGPIRRDHSLLADLIANVGPAAMPIFQELRTWFTASPRYGAAVLAHTDPASFKDPIVQAGLWRDFVQAEPRRHSLSDDQARALNRMMQAINTTAGAKQLFEKTYPEIKDKAAAEAADNQIKATDWSRVKVRRLHNTLSQHLPVSNVQTLSAGFYLVTQYRDDWNDANPFVPVDFAYYWNNGCFLPDASAGRDGGGTNHDMTGGRDSGAAEAQRDNRPYMTHFATSTLHEVGHGVGEHGGDAWAAGAGGGTPAFRTGLPVMTVINKLYQANVVEAAYGNDPSPLPKPAKGTDPDSATVAGRFMAAVIAGNGSPPLGGLTRAEMEDYCDLYASSQKLYDYYAAGRTGANAYRFDGDACVAGDGRVYTYLTRGDTAHQWTSYLEAAWSAKVSWYSLSSVKEWFAEQYAHYHRTSPKGRGQSAAVQAKIREISEQVYDPSANGGSGGLIDRAPGSASGDAAATGGGASGGSRRQVQRAPFPW